MNPFIVGITGGSGAGKTFFIDKLVEALPENTVCQISQDNYYKNIEDVPVDQNGIKNFDLPNAVNFNAFVNDLEALRQGKKVTLQEYTFNNRSKTPGMIELVPAPLIIVEGIFAFVHENLQQLFDFKIFIDAPEIVKIKRRIMRDAIERGYDMKDVLYRYEHHVNPSYTQFTEPHRQTSDIVIPNSGDMQMSVAMLSAYLKTVINHS